MSWMPITSEMPKDGRVVLTRIQGTNRVRNIRNIRNIQNLKRVGDLWWLPDGGMDVQWTPTHHFDESAGAL